MEHLLSALVDSLISPLPGTDAAPAYLIQKNRTDAVLVLKDSLTALVFVTGAADADLAARVQSALAAERPEVRTGVLEAVWFLILVGDTIPAPPAAVPAGVFEVLAVTATSSAFLATSQPLQLKGEVPSNRARVLQELDAALARLARSTTALPPETLARVEQEGESALAAEGVYARRLGHPWGTMAVLIASILVFVLQLRLGGTDGPILVRMGANIGERVAAGEWERLVTSGWLHGGALHFFSNMVFVYLVGLFLEAALGATRIVALYIALLIASEAAVAYLRPLQIGCGASGGVLGLLAALAVLSWRTPHLVPPISGQGNSVAATVYILIQLLYSFQPDVSFVAHFAGAVAGAALVLSGVPQAGLPTLQSGAREPGWSRVAGWLAALTAVGVTLFAFREAFAHGRPWDGLAPPRFVAAKLEPSHLRGQFPSGSLARMTVTTGADLIKYRLGDYRIDPLVISLIDRNHEVADTDGAAALAHLQDTIKADQDPGRWSAPVIKALGKRKAARTEHRRYGNNLVRWLFGVGGREVDVQISWVAPATIEHETKVEEALALLERD